MTSGKVLEDMRESRFRLTSSRRRRSSFARYEIVLGALNLSAIELGAENGFSGRCVPLNVRDDLLAMKASVLDEHLVRIEPGHDDTRDEESRHVGLQRPGRARECPLSGRSNADLPQQVGVRREARHHVHAGRRAASIFAARRRDRDVVARRSSARGCSSGRRCFPPSFAIQNVGKHPRLDLLVERRAEMHERHPRTGAPEIQRRLGGRISAADDDRVLVERLVPLAVDVRSHAERLAGHAAASSASRSSRSRS